MVDLLILPATFLFWDLKLKSSLAFGSRASCLLNEGFEARVGLAQILGVLYEADCALLKQKRKTTGESRSLRFR